MPTDDQLNLQKKKKKKGQPDFVQKAIADFLEHPRSMLQSGGVFTDVDDVKKWSMGIGSKYDERKGGGIASPGDAARHAAFGFELSKADREDLLIPRAKFLGDAREKTAGISQPVGMSAHDPVAAKSALDDLSHNPLWEPVHMAMGGHFENPARQLDFHNNQVGFKIAELADSREQAEEVIEQLMSNVRIYESEKELLEDPPKPYQLAALREGTKPHGRGGPEAHLVVKPVEHRPTEKAKEVAKKPKNLDVYAEQLRKAAVNRRKQLFLTEAAKVVQDAEAAFPAIPDEQWLRMSNREVELMAKKARYKSK